MSPRLLSLGLIVLCASASPTYPMDGDFARPARTDLGARGSSRLPRSRADSPRPALRPGERRPGSSLRARSRAAGSSTARAVGDRGAGAARPSAPNASGRVRLARTPTRLGNAAVGRPDRSRIFLPRARPGGSTPAASVEAAWSPRDPRPAGGRPSPAGEGYGLALVDARNRGGSGSSVGHEVLADRPGLGGRREPGSTTTRPSTRGAQGRGRRTRAVVVVGTARPRSRPPSTPFKRGGSTNRGVRRGLGRACLPGRGSPCWTNAHRRSCRIPSVEELSPGQAGPRCNLLRTSEPPEATSTSSARRAPRATGEVQGRDLLSDDDVWVRRAAGHAGERAGGVGRGHLVKVTDDGVLLGAGEPARERPSSSRWPGTASGAFAGERGRGGRRNPLPDRRTPRRAGRATPRPCCSTYDTHKTGGSTAYAYARYVNNPGRILASAPGTGR